MTKSHLKRLIAPKTWQINRKHETFILRPNSGGHNMDVSITLKDLLITIGKATTLREVKYVLYNHEILVDKKKRRDPAFPVGVFDILSLPEINEAYTLFINKLNKLVIKKLNDPKSDTKLIKIVAKRKIKGNKVQIETMCGRNIIVEDKDVLKYKTGDSLMIKLPGQKIVDHKKFEKGAEVYLIKGTHVGLIGKVKSIEGEKLIFTSGKTDLETKKDYAFVVVEEVAKLLK
jgi:small subunit ribosomal protein S4e